MNGMLSRWDDLDIMPLLASAKSLFHEGEDMERGQFPTGFEEAASSRQGALLFCVQRGRLSEGADFKDTLARAVICIGVPFSNIGDPGVFYKRGFNTKYCGSQHLQTGSQWYSTQAYRALNQSLGRLIRHAQDWGAIILLDSRLCRPTEQANLSPWVQSLHTVWEDFGTGRAYLEGFFTARDKTLMNYSQCSSDL